MCPEIFSTATFSRAARKAGGACGRPDLPRLSAMQRNHVEQHFVGGNQRKKRHLQDSLGTTAVTRARQISVRDTRTVPCMRNKSVHWRALGGASARRAMQANKQDRGTVALYSVQDTSHVQGAKVLYCCVCFGCFFVAQVAIRTASHAFGNDNIPAIGSPATRPKRGAREAKLQRETPATAGTPDSSIDLPPATI